MILSLHEIVLQIFQMDKVKLEFQPEVLDYIVDKAIEFKLGARGLRTIVETIMIDAMFDIPSSGAKSFKVSKQYAADQLCKANFDVMQQAQAE